MSFLDELRPALSELAGPDDRPLVVFAALWPVFREMRRADAGAVEDLLNLLVEVADGRDLLMPSFAEGYRDGVCDLDQAPSSTGVLSERFRQRPETLRTLSAFFSFNIMGPSREALGRLLPVDAWGDGSVYDWMEQRNARFLMFGTHPTHCSYLHRMEWLVRERLPYRYRKAFSGTLVRNAERIAVEETLYVRNLAPEVDNDFTRVLPLLREAGMRELPLKGVSLAAYDTCPVRDAILARLRDDPLLVLKNRGDYERRNDECND